MVIISKISRIY